MATQNGTMISKEENNQGSLKGIQTAASLKKQPELSMTTYEMEEECQTRMVEMLEEWAKSKNLM